ncbi:MAG: hypothetical protein AAF283_10015 [Cyanobacteria bacterium P01_A01_bin.70]
MRRLLVGLLIAIALVLAIAPPALAHNCRIQNQHEICLERVQRSAKYHWRYRVQATIDGEPQPLTRYNCRDRTRTLLAGTQKGLTQPFSPEGVGVHICQLLNR